MNKGINYLIRSSLYRFIWKVSLNSQVDSDMNSISHAKKENRLKMIVS